MPLRAVVVKKILSTDTELGLERAGPVVDFRVDHLAVAGRGLHADCAVSLQNNDGAPATQREAVGHRQADDTRSDDLHQRKPVMEKKMKRWMGERD